MRQQSTPHKNENNEHYYEILLLKKCPVTKKAYIRRLGLKTNTF